MTAIKRFFRQLGERYSHVLPAGKSYGQRFVDYVVHGAAVPSLVGA